MKLLAKKEIDSKVNDQKKSEIDAGLFLARKIDHLREDLADTQKEHDDRVASIKKEFVLFSGEIASKRGDLEQEIRDLEEKRIELMIPLDAERLKYNTLQQEQSEWRDKLIKDDYEILLKQIDIEDKQKKINEILSRVSINEQEIEKKKKEIENLNKLAKEYKESTKKEYFTQLKEHEKKIRELSDRENEYNIAIKTLEIKKKELEEKESNLIIREKHLASQQVSLRIAWEKIKNHA